VFFGADDVTSFTINSNTSITVSSPAHAAGGVSVTVENPGGTSGGQPYTFDAIPTLTGISPPNGSTVGGNTVTLTGTGFTGATDVNFGGTDIQNTGCGGGPCFSVTNDTTISVTNIPGGAAGAVDVDVVTPGGTSGTQQYTYMGASLSNVSPPSGSSVGGNSVTLTGALFTGATDVNVGSHDLNACGTGACFTFISDTEITVTMPANNAGVVPVDVVTPAGTTNTLNYTYTSTLTGLSPSSGTTDGGNPVVLTGTGFNGATDVNVGSNDLTPCPSAPCFTINSNTQITVTMPANIPQTVSVTVTTPGGTTTSEPYTYVAPLPTVTAISSDEGLPSGGTPDALTLTGTDFEAAGTSIVSQVTVGATAITLSSCAAQPTAPCFAVTSPTSITIGYMPAGTGQVYITVTNSTGTSAETSSNEYTYNSAFPAVTEVLPAYGAESGGEEITLNGSGFGAAGQDFVSDVWFGSIDVSNSSTSCAGSSAGCFVVIGPTQLDVYTPASTAAGTVQVQVVTPIGRSAGLTDDYTFVAAGAYTPLTPYRVCDTRVFAPGVAHNQCNTGNNKTLGPYGTVTAQITTTTAGQVPMHAQAVVVNVTAIDHSTTSTYVVAYPAGVATRPTASNINLSGGKVGSNLVIVQLSASGQITLYNAAGSTDVIVDVQGYFTTPTPSSTAGEFHPIPPLRICDSRANAHTECAGATNNPLIGGHWSHVVLSGDPPGGTGQSIPASSAAAAAVFNLTGVGGTAPTTFLSVTPALPGNTCPIAAPAFSNLNPAEGTALPNRVISELGPDQDVCIYNASGDINIVIDLNGWFGSSTATAGALFYSIPPTRVCDTRANSHTACSVPSGLGLAPGEIDPILMAGSIAVPADYAHSTAPVAVVANLTGIAGNAITLFTLYPNGAAQPHTSDLNPAPGAVIANLAIVEISTTNGDVNLYNAAGHINAILDVAGWFQ
jgi:hypothetical protein